MPSKIYTIDNIGDVTVFKRHGTKRINLRVVNGKVRITQPFWLPYATGVQFAVKNHNWINEQIKTHPVLDLKERDYIGKYHQLEICHGKSLRTKTTAQKAIIYIPPNMHIQSPKAVSALKTLVKKTLKEEAKTHFPKRLKLMADTYGFRYQEIKFKSLKSRWGSCNNNGDITLNIYLMALDWDLIDYVLLHELAHTEYMHHGKPFWNIVSRIMPDYKLRKKKLKEFQKKVAILQ
jgi:predicted metal-dependent hydrolase